MAIRILPQDEIQQAAHSFQQPALLFSNPKNLYQRRIKRLKELSENHPLNEYLNFVVQLVEAQLQILIENPLPKYPLGFNAIHPLDKQTWQRDAKWHEYLTALLEQIEPQANEQMLGTIDFLKKAANEEIEQLADKLLSEQYTQVGSDKAVFIWAALSLYWLQLTQQLPQHTQAESGDDLHCCPVCNAAPVSSIIHFGAAQGLRYLHCSLCESEWHVVRAKCTNCNQSKELDYWAIDKDQAEVKSESCGECHSHLKILYQEKNPHVEPVADDLASIFLDVELEEKGFARSGLNPFMFPSE